MAERAERASDGLVDEQVACPGIGDHRRERRRGRRLRDRRGGRAGSQCAEEHGRVLDRIRGGDRDRVADADRVALERRGDPVDAAVELREADAALVVNERRVTWPVDRVQRDEIGEGDERLRQRGVELRRHPRILHAAHATRR